MFQTEIDCAVSIEMLKFANETESLFGRIKRDAVDVSGVMKSIRPVLIIITEIENIKDSAYLLCRIDHLL